MVNDLHRGHIPNEAVRPLFIVPSSPDFHHDLRFLPCQKPVRVQTFIPTLAVEAQNKHVLQRLPRLNEVQLHAVLHRPGIQGRPDAFRPIIQDHGVRNRGGVNSRSRIQHPHAPPIETSTSITETSIEQRSIIVKH